jgi:hypothetical protein
MKTYYLSDFSPKANKNADDTEEFIACFSAAAKNSGPVRIIIEPGEYLLQAIKPVPLFSDLTVEADGAEFYWPENLNNPKHRDMFAGSNIQNLRWHGGHFHGYVYNVPPEVSKWPPESLGRCIVIETTSEGNSSNLRFFDIEGTGCSGSVVSVYGFRGDEKMNRARNLEIRNCRFERCGKFMWDYGYLWERLVFAKDFSPEEQAIAQRWASPENRSGAVIFHGDYITADAMPPYRHEERYPWDCLCFYGDGIPPEIDSGKIYFIVREERGKIYFSQTPSGKPIRTSPSLCGGAKLFRNLFGVFHWGYAPVNQGTGKGALDLVCCQNVGISGCTLSANGDTMHIMATSNVVFSDNQITGSRMGAFFLAFDCDHVTATGNIVDGTNGSRVLTVEKGCREIVISGNIFMGGGRGCWFNRAKNVILSDNVFSGNVLKGTPVQGIGRRSPFSGGFEKYPELYFTHAGGNYGGIIVRSNLFEATHGNTQPTILFQENGSDLILENNIFHGGTRQISIADTVHLQMDRNIGISRLNAKKLAEPL